MMKRLSSSSVDGSLAMRSSYSRALHVVQFSSEGGMYSDGTYLTGRDIAGKAAAERATTARVE